MDLSIKVNRHSVLIYASLSLIFVSPAATAGTIGHTSIYTNQNELLLATIEVSDIIADDFSVSLASKSHYQKLNMQKSVPISVRFDISSPSSGKIVLTSNQPISEPFADVVLIVNNNGEQQPIPKTLLLPLGHSAALPINALNKLNHSKTENNQVQKKQVPKNQEDYKQEQDNTKTNIGTILVVKNSEPPNLNPVVNETTPNTLLKPEKTLLAQAPTTQKTHLESNSSVTNNTYTKLGVEEKEYEQPTVQAKSGVNAERLEPENMNWLDKSSLPINSDTEISNNSIVDIATIESQVEPVVNTSQSTVVKVRAPNNNTGDINSLSTINHTNKLPTVKSLINHSSANAFEDIAEQPLTSGTQNFNTQYYSNNVKVKIAPPVYSVVNAEFLNEENKGAVPKVLYKKSSPVWNKMAGGQENLGLMSSTTYEVSQQVATLYQPTSFSESKSIDTFVTNTSNDHLISKYSMSAVQWKMNDNQKDGINQNRNSIFFEPISITTPDSNISISILKDDSGLSSKSTA